MCKDWITLCMDTGGSDWTGRCELPSSNDCEATGGTEYDWGCFCGTDSYFIKGEGGCVESDMAQDLCETSGGAWTETPNFEEASMNSPTERYYCACEDSFYESFTGACSSLLNSQMVCVSGCM